MKRRRSNAALTHMKRLFGGDEAVAEEDLHAPHGALFHERTRLCDKDLANVFGVVDEDNGRAHEAVVGDVAVGLVEVLEEQDGAAELDPRLEGIEGKRARQAGRESVLGRDHDYASVAALRCFRRSLTTEWMMASIFGMEASSRMATTRCGSRAAMAS